jgi:hypothetical protein
MHLHFAVSYFAGNAAWFISQKTPCEIITSAAHRAYYILTKSKVLLLSNISVFKSFTVRNQLAITRNFEVIFGKTLNRSA